MVNVSPIASGAGGDAVTEAAAADAVDEAGPEVAGAGVRGGSACATQGESSKNPTPHDILCWRRTAVCRLFFTPGMARA